MTPHEHHVRTWRAESAAFALRDGIDYGVWLRTMLFAPRAGRVRTLEPAWWPEYDEDLGEEAA